MNRKTFYKISGACLLVALILIAYFFFFSKKIPPSSVVTQEKPSFNTPTTTLPISIPAITTYSSTTNCTNASSIERDDCILKKASATQNIKDCSDIQGVFAKTYCTTLVSSKTKYTEVSLSSYAPIPSSAKVSIISPGDAQIKSGEVLSEAYKKLSTSLKDTLTSISNDPRTSFSGFLDRVANKVPLALFIVNPITSKIGDRVTATGSGFLKSGNTITIGSQTVSNLESADGMTISFIVPQIPNDRYEVFVTNSRGSSRVAERPIYMTIADNPEPIPVLTGVTPSKPTINDTITVNGENLNNLVGVYTSLGTASGISFKISDLQFYNLLKESISKITSKTVPIIIMVMTSSGLSQQLSVDVTVK